MNRLQVQSMYALENTLVETGLLVQFAFVAGRRCSTVLTSEIDRHWVKNNAIIAPLSGAHNRAGSWDLILGDGRSLRCAGASDSLLFS